MKTLDIFYKTLIAFSPGCDRVYCMKYQHGSTFVWSCLCSNLCLYDIDLHCMSSSYVQLWVLYHMDLHCILVAMLVYSSHGSALYWYAAMSLVTCVYESTYWCTINSYLNACSDRANIFFSWQRLVLKPLIYHITLRLMLWGASCYTKILSPSCDKTFDIPTCPEISASGVKTKWFVISLSYKFPAPRMPLYPGAVPLFAPPFIGCPQAVPPPIALGP